MSDFVRGADADAAAREYIPTDDSQLEHKHWVRATDRRHAHGRFMAETITLGDFDAAKFHAAQWNAWDEEVWRINSVMQAAYDASRGGAQ